MKKKILIAPQTIRNFEQILLYLINCKAEYDFLFISSGIFGYHCNICNSSKESLIKIISADFLSPDMVKASRFRRAIYMKHNHDRFKIYLNSIKPDLIIVASDSDGFGRWITFVAKETGFKVLVLQEGTRWSTTQWNDPISIKAKLFLGNIFYTIYYPPGNTCWQKEYQTGDYAAVWGEFDRQKIISNGKRSETVFVIGDPRVPSRNENRQKKISRNVRILYLDAPTHAVPIGTFDQKKFEHFRIELVKNIIQLKITLSFKPHPLTVKNEKERLAKWLLKNRINFIDSGSAEEFYSQHDICISHPSTSIFTALAFGIPLIQVILDAKGFGTLLWNPVLKYGAGITITRAEELSNAIQTVKSPDWQNSYFKSSQTAAEEMIGPLDGKASDRFANAIRQIV